MMSLPMSPLLWVAAGIPIIFLLAAIMKLGWGVAKAAPVGMLLAGIIAVAAYRSGLSAL